MRVLLTSLALIAILLAASCGTSNVIATPTATPTPTAVCASIDDQTVPDISDIDQITPGALETSIASDEATIAATTVFPEPVCTLI